jgi:hypothetical protein
MNSYSNIPFEFILDYLNKNNVRIKPMFGCFAVYVGNKLVFLLRDRKEKTELNGVWLASSVEKIESLSLEFPIADREVKLVESKKSSGTWLLIPKDNREFEEAVIKACEMVACGDDRIGKITASSVMIK